VLLHVEVAELENAFFVRSAVHSTLLGIINLVSDTLVTSCNEVENLGAKHNRKIRDQLNIKLIQESPEL
jgi:hypothetical protein